ncbi:hypothetical protein [Actinokineospora sp. NPDC004072]
MTSPDAVRERIAKVAAEVPLPGADEIPPRTRTPLSSDEAVRLIQERYAAAIDLLGKI